jgi:hypothetical protein
MVTEDTDMADTVGGVLRFIIRPVGVDGVVDQGLMGSMVIIFMFTTTYMLTTPIMFTETEVVYPARDIIVREGLRPEQRIITVRP